MFGFSSSSDDDRDRTRTITIAYADADSVEVATEYSDSYSSYSSYTATPSSTLATPSTLGSGRAMLDIIDKEREIETYFGYHPVWRKMSLSDGIKITTLEYFWDHRIFQLFNFLITHLLAHTPDDPVSFLADLVERCIRYRDEGEDPPLVFEDDHIRSVYVSLDPLVEGSISYSQYLVGMSTLGLTEFNILPDDTDEHQNVAKDVFIEEAKSALMMQLNVILGKDRRTTISIPTTVDDYENCRLNVKPATKK